MADKQELPPRSKAAKEPGVIGIKASGKQAIKANSVGLPKGGAARFSQESGIDKEERRQMIAEAAYYRYQNRGYEAGCGVDDWLAAEAEIDRMLDF